jgi:hypothetical protein
MVEGLTRCAQCHVTRLRWRGLSAVRDGPTRRAARRGRSQFSLKNVCPSRSLSVSRNDSLVSGAATCAPVAGTRIIFNGFAARRLATFLADSPFAPCFGFKTSPPDFGVTGFGATSSSENALCRGRADCTDVIDVEGLMFDGARMVGKLVSIMTVQVPARLR